MSKGKHQQKTSTRCKVWIAAACILGVALLALLGVLVFFVGGNSTGNTNSAGTISNAESTASAANAASTSATDTTTSNTGATSAAASAAQSFPAISDNKQSSGALAHAEKKAEEVAAAQANASAAAAAEAEKVEAAKDFSPRFSAQGVIDSIPASDAAQSFTLNDKRSAPTIDTQALEAIDAACKTLTDAGYSYSAVLIDINSGRGVGIGTTTPIYTASSFKAPLSEYLLENDLTSEWELGNIEASILYSDNDAFEALATNHMDAAYQDWLAAHDIEYDGWSPWYPKASARGMAACWADIYHFIRSGDADVEWFKDLLANTNLSFIRNALDGEDVSVWNKGGWLSDPEYNAVADCGIVEANGRSYIVCVLTDQPSYGEAHERVYDIIRALWACRDYLR